MAGSEQRDPYTTRKTAAATFRTILRRLFGGLRAILGAGRRQVTVMLIPHSEGSVRRTKVNLVTLVFLGVLVAAIGVSTALLAFRMESMSNSANSSDRDLLAAQASLEGARSEILNVLDAYSEFSDSLASILNDASPNPTDSPEAADLRAFLFGDGRPDGGMPELAALRNVTDELQNLNTPLQEVSDALGLQSQVLRDLPILWPVINGLGHISMEFGPNVHPILGVWYMHKGVDVAYLSGTPVVATGNGVVVDAGWDTVSGYGGFVEIEHPYGFTTKYAHLAQVRAKVGQHVEQGDTIGVLGSTGISTGPHVHYEVKIGTEVIDPAPLLKIAKPVFRRRVDDRS